jgi:hypothetical protein
MRTEMPMRWIEEAEARQVLVTALSEGKSIVSLRNDAEAAASELLVRLRSWLDLRRPAC